MTSPPAVAVVVLAYGNEPLLHPAVEAILASAGVTVELVVVDNGCTSDAVSSLPADPRLAVVTPGTNLGFAGGVNLGAEIGSAPYLAFVNSDAIVAPDCLAELVRALDDTDLGIVSGQVLLATEPPTLNTVGNPLHILGLSWAGHMGEDPAAHPTAQDIASATGATMAMRRSTWQELGGFTTEYFAYLEDLELSWRAWQGGWRVRYVPTAVSVHHYEFSRNASKLYLLERNRLIFVLTCYGPRMLAALAIPLLAFELAIATVATIQGWGRQKLGGWAWVVRHSTWVRARRRAVQAARRVSDHDLARLLTARFDPAQLALPPGGSLLQTALAVYWRAARRLI